MVKRHRDPGGWWPAPNAPFLVISDIDDTILLTGLTEGVTMVARTVLHEASQRGRFRACHRSTAVWSAG